MSANDDKQLDQHQHQQHDQDEEQQVEEQQQVDEEEVTDLQLEEAARQGNVELLERVPLQRLVDFEHSRGRKGGEWLLEEALDHGQGGVVQCLVRRSVESGQDFVRGWTLGHAAAFAGDLEALQLLDADELSARSASGSTLMHATALGGHVAAIDRLVELDVKATRNDGFTTIHSAAANGHVAAIDRLVDLGVDPKATKKDGWTTIHAAASNGHVAAIDRLVELGVDPKATTNDGWTTIHAAALKGLVAAIERLVELGVDPKATKNDGWTTIHAAASNGHVAAIDRLVELGVDPKATRNDGFTTIHAATLNGHVTAIERLVELEVDPKATANGGWTTIHLAAVNGHVAAIDRLENLGVDAKAMANGGGTSLQIAASAREATVVAYLLMTGADPSRQPHGERWGLDLASKEWLLQATRGWLVRRSGADVLRVEQVDSLSPEFEPTVDLAALGSVDSSRLDQVLAVWPQLQSLEGLCLRGLAASDFARFAPRLSELSALRRLLLGGVEGETLRVSASQLGAIASLPLTALELSHAVLEDSTALRDCTSLGSLNLSSCALSTADLDIIAALPQLQRLDLRRARFPSLGPLAGGCAALRSLDVRDCGLASAPSILASLPRLQQLFVLDNPFADELQAYRRLLADAASAVDFLRALSLSSENKMRDVPVVLVGHGRAGKSQVIRALLHEAQVEPGAVEHVELVTERTSKVESGVGALQLSAERRLHTRRRREVQVHMDEFEARFFDTPGQMEFFASNIAVIAPLFSSSVVVVVVRCVPHGVGGADISLVAEKKRIASEFRLWLAEVSRAMVNLWWGSATHDHTVGDSERRAGGDPMKHGEVLLVLTHRDVLEEARGETAVDDMVVWLDSVCSELRDEFSETLDVQHGIDFVNGTVASESGHGVAPLRERLATTAHGVFKNGPLLPSVLVDARAQVVSDEVRLLRVCEVETLEDLLTSRFCERGLTPRLAQRLLEVLESNGSVLRTPRRQLVVVDPGWISRVMSSLYVDPKAHDVAGFSGDPSDFDALAAFDKDGEVQASELQGHLRRFVDGDDALLERLLLVLVSNGIVIPLRVRSDINGVPVVESYLIVGRLMDAQDDDGCVQWSSSRQDEASLFELVTGQPYSLQNVASAFALAPILREQRPSFHLTSLRCETRGPMGPSFLTRMVHRLAQLFRSQRHSFLVRRTDFACVLPFTRFHAAVHVRLPSSANAFELTLVAARNDAEAALEFALLDCVFPVLKMMTLDERDHWLHMKQRCSACVATREDLTSRIRHDRDLSGEVVREDVEAVRALCREVVGDGRNWQYDECRGCGGALSTVEVAQVDDKQHSNSFGDSFVPEIPPASINLDDASVLGSGQSGSVLMGEFNGTEVVLKELKVSSKEALAAFEREAQLLGRACKHPCISLLLGVCRMSEAHVYVVMERAGVCDLEQALCEPPEKPLLGATWAEFGVLLGLLADVASALRHMHSQDPPIVHNDVALRNVLVRHENGRNRAKLTDMGLARAVPRGRVHKLAPGTPVPKWQMAPETLESRAVSPASDVFQFGMLVYEVLARQRPFWREWKTPGRKKERSVAREAVVERIKTGRRPSREDVPAAGAYCDDALWQLAEECWLDDPLLRPSMVQVSTRLAKLIRERGGIPGEQAPLGQRSAATQGPHYPKLASEPVDDDDDDDDDSGDDDEEAKAEDDDDRPAHAPAPAAPADVSDWTLDDVCAWLLQLNIPTCVELVPLFRHHGVDGAVLRLLDVDTLAEVSVSRLTALVLLRARDKLLSS